MSNCFIGPDGKKCPIPSNYQECKPWDLTLSKDQCFIDQQLQEALTIAGANINVHKLLGVHEQTKLVDLTGKGTPISGGDAPNYPAINAFTKFNSKWRSKQTGADNILNSAYIGYDFGVLRLSNGRQRYGIDADIREHITTLRIKQSSNPNERVLKVRVERSDDGKQWYGVATINLPDNDQLNTINFKQSVPSRYWRLRPLIFKGGINDSWSIVALEMMDYSVTSLSNLQDPILMENRDRDYMETPIKIKGYYDLVEPVTDLTRFGIDIGISTEYRIRVSFNDVVSKLGRPIVIGDILELPSETQYTPDLKPVKRYLEVTQVMWDVSTYTPGWQPLMLAVTAKPAYASQETQDIFGDLNKKVDGTGLFNIDDGNDEKYQDFSNVTETIAKEAITEVTGVPEYGSEGSNTIRSFEKEELEQAASVGINHLNKIGFNPTGLYVEDAIPQNGAPYTEGPTFPTNPKNGDYHRLTYTGLAQDVPARLYRWSDAKGRWIYLETDRRQQFNEQKAMLTEYLTSKYKKSAKKER